MGEKGKRKKSEKRDHLGEGGSKVAVSAGERKKRRKIQRENTAPSNAVNEEEECVREEKINKRK